MNPNLMEQFLGPSTQFFRFNANDINVLVTPIDKKTCLLTKRNVIATSAAATSATAISTSTSTNGTKSIEDSGGGGGSGCNDNASSLATSISSSRIRFTTSNGESMGGGGGENGNAPASQPSSASSSNLTTTIKSTQQGCHVNTVIANTNRYKTLNSSSTPSLRRIKQINDFDLNIDLAAIKFTPPLESATKCGRNQLEAKSNDTQQINSDLVTTSSSSSSSSSTSPSSSSSSSSSSPSASPSLTTNIDTDDDCK
jgi:hypothetical protein